MKKRVLSTVLVICMLCALFPASILTASAETFSGSCGKQLAWTLDTETGILEITGTGEMTGYPWSWLSYCDLIKSVIIGNGVTSIGGSAFYGCTSLTDVTIPDSVTSIGYSAFSGCTSLTGVTIPNSVTSIGSSAFRRCTSLAGITIPDSVPNIDSYAFEDCSSLTSVTIPKSVTSIGSYAFYGCSSLISMIIPDSVTNIGSSAFRRCTSLVGITIPDSVTNIGGMAFYGCTSLTGIWVDENNANYSSDEKGVLFNKDKTELRKCPEGYVGDYTIPDSVTSVGEAAFENCTSLTGVIIPNGVPSIGIDAFYGCTSLVSVTIPGSVTSIDGGAFENCASLTDVTIPDSVTSIGYAAFYGCDSLTNVTIPESVSRIEQVAFGNCTGLAGIWVSEDNRRYSNDEKGVLFNKNKTKLLQCPGGYVGNYTISDSVTTIDGGAFYGCTGLTGVTIPDSVTDIYWGAFENCTSLTSVTIPDGVTSILPSTFADCTSLTSVTIPNSVTSIWEGAFYGCTSLAGVTIPDSVTDIGESAFKGCASLTDITIPDSVTGIGESAFENCTSLTSVTIPDSVTSIGNYAFSHTGLINVTIPDSVTSIGPGAFRDCTSLTGMTIPDSVTSIGSYTFEDCTSLTSVVIPDSVTSIGWGAFYGCTGLTGVTIPESVSRIEQRAFANCTSMTGIWVDENNPNYSSDEKGVLFNKDKTDLIQSPGGYVGNYTVSDTVTDICHYAFYGCTSLTSVTIPDSVTGIWHYAFGGCTGLQSVCLLGDAPTTFYVDAFKVWNDETETEINIPGLILYYIEGKVGWTSPTWKGYPTAMWDGVNLPHIHSYQVVVTAPTCTEQGYTTHTCTACGDSYVDTYVDALGHKYENGVCVQCGEKDPNEQPTIEFVDVPQKAWYVEAVNYAVQNGLMNGVGNDQFNPEGSMTRAMLVTVLWRYEGEPEAGKNTFSDVPNGQWYTKAVAWAAENGIVGGVGNNRFDPNGEITREQMATILFRYAEKKGIDTSKRGSLNIFSDEKQLSAYAKDAVQWAVAEQIINGSDGKLLPQGSATRAQVATILMRFIENKIK